MENKSTIRKTLEQIEEDILKSWQRDMDKVSQLCQLGNIIQQILESESIEAYFKSIQADVDYFLKKFSKETINNILKQYYIYGSHGDDVALKVLFGYVQIFLKFMDIPQYSPLWESVKEIFDETRHFYKPLMYGNILIDQERRLRKQMCAEYFNEHILPKDTSKIPNLQEGDIIDVYIDNRKPYYGGHLNDKKIWNRGRIFNLEKEYIYIKVADECGSALIKRNAFNYAEKGKMTRDYEWRTTLKTGDTIDCYDRCRWFPATVLEKTDFEVNGLPYVMYKVGFRVYLESVANWMNYTKVWPDTSVMRDCDGKMYIGDGEAMDEPIPYYSKRIQPFGSMSGEACAVEDNFYIDDIVPFVNDTDGSKNYIIARNSTFSFYYSLLVSLLCEHRGYEQLIENLVTGKLTTETAHIILSIISRSSLILHKEYLMLLSPLLQKNISEYINNLSQNDLRSIKKDTVDIIVKILNYFLYHTLSQKDREEFIQQFSLKLSLKMLKTSILDKRITAMKTIVDVIRNCKTEFTLKLIEDNHIFYEIFGPNSHTQLINKSKDILEFMAREDKLSQKEIEMIWGATKKGDFEGKLTILKILKDLSQILQPHQVTLLLDTIYHNTQDIIIEEVQLIFELVALQKNDCDAERGLTYFINALLRCQEDEKEKISLIIKKIIQITHINDKLKENVLQVCLHNIETNHHSNFTFKLFQVFISDMDNETCYRSILTENNHIVNLYLSNFRKYNEHVKIFKKKIQGGGEYEYFNIDKVHTDDDSSSHAECLLARLDFLNFLISRKMWESSNLIHPIDFLYEMMIVDGISQKDKQEFFKWINSYILNDIYDSLSGACFDYNDRVKIFELFNEKICTDQENLENLSKEAFETYLKVFLDINAVNKDLEYTIFNIKSANDTPNYDVTVFGIPDKLKGFDILWRIVFTNRNDEIINRGINHLFMLYNKMKVVEQIDDRNSLEHLLKKCIDLIRETMTDDDHHHEKLLIVKKSFKVLSLMIEESERKGTVRVKSHFGLLKRKVISLFINSFIVKTPDFYIRVYGNTTMWDLKEIIADKANVVIDFLKMTIKGKYEIQDTDNGKTVMDMLMSDGDEIRITLNSNLTLIPRGELISNGEIIPRLKKIINDWFDRFSTNGKLLPENCGQFVRAVTNSNEEIGPNDTRVIELLKNYDSKNEGFISREGFLKFYYEAAFNKKNVVWDNLRNMGIRNDLHRIDEPIENYNTDKTILPRFTLAHNETFFNTIFNLQDIDGEIAKEAFNFICIITTNPVIYKQILQFDDISLLDSTNIFKLIYSLQIIESFLEDIEIESTNVDSFSNEEYILDSNDVSLDVLREKKIEWMRKFVTSGGFAQLVTILENKLTVLNSEENSVMNRICLQYLLKIVRIFFFSSLNKFEINKQVNVFLKKLRSTAKQSTATTDDNNHFDIETDQILDLGYGGSSSEEVSNVIYANVKDNHTNSNTSLSKQNIKNIDSQLDKIFEGELGEKIHSCLDYIGMTDKLLSLLATKVTDIQNSKSEDMTMYEDSFETLIGIISFSQPKEYQELEKRLVTSNVFEKISFAGLLSENAQLKEKWGNSLIRLTKVCSFFKKFNLISYQFRHAFEVLLNIETYSSKLNASELFEFFSNLLEVYLNNKDEFNKSLDSQCQFTNLTAPSPEEFLLRIAKAIHDDIYSISKSSISNDIFIGYLKILSKSVESSAEIKSLISKEYNLIEGVLTSVLFKQSNKELSDLIQCDEITFIDPDKFEDIKSSRNSNQAVRNACYNFILSMVSSSVENFERLFSFNVLTDVKRQKEEEKEEKETNENFLNQQRKEKNNSNSEFYSRSYISHSPKVEGHVGLRNLRFICYMNSVLQQFYMVPTFRHGILQISDNIPPNKTSNCYNIDDNVFHQVQRMFSYLSLSNRSDYNPQGFCYAFKDYDGNPVDISLQQDSNEFLSRFIEKMENAMKPTPWKYLIDSVFKGRLCSQLICEQGCNTSRNRYEEFYALSLEVKNMKNIYESLDKYISPEKIDDYNCETCNRKVQITKRNVLADLPNVLIVHLQRLYYDYETDRNEKINSKLEFPKVLNLKNFTMEEQSRKSAIKRAKTGEVSDTALENEEIYFKPDEYYEYHLLGVNVHYGVADAGHYFSYINTIRDGSGSVMHFDPNNEIHSKSWLTFNDSQISKFSSAKLEDECYGGRASDDKGENMFGFRGNNDSIQSAYMLVYERRIKTPLKILVSNDSPVIVNNSDPNLEIFSYKPEEYLSIKKQFNLVLHFNKPGYQELANRLFNKLIFYDIEKNEYYRHIPFFEVEKKIPKQYFIEILEDNSQLQKHQNISDEQFVKFFEEIINSFSDTMTVQKDNQDQDDMSTMNNTIISTFMNFIFVLLSNKDKQKLLRTAKCKFINILDYSANNLQPVCQYYVTNIKMLLDYLLNDNLFIAQIHSEMLAEVVNRAYSKNPEEFMEESCASGRGMSMWGNILTVIDTIFALFPKIPNKLVHKVGPILSFFKQICTNNDDMVEYLSKKDFICVLSTFCVGRESPCFGDFQSSKDDNWDSGRPMLISCEPAIEVIGMICMKTQEFQGGSGENETAEIPGGKKIIKLSEKNRKCIKHPSFLKFLFKHGSKLFKDFAIGLCYDDPEYSIQCCKDIACYIEEIRQYDLSDLNRVLEVIFALLRISDNLQIVRIEIIIGYPQIIMEDANYRYKMPYFGYHNMIDYSGKVFEMKGLNNCRSSSCLMKKFYNLHDKDQQAEVFLLLMNECKKNMALLKYLRNFPSEDLGSDDFIQFGRSSINQSFRKSEFSQFFKEIVDTVNPILKGVVFNTEIIKNFSYFSGKYLHNDIKREEFTLVGQFENLYIIRCDYHTNILQYSKTLDFTKSKSYESTFVMFEDEKELEEIDSQENNITSTDTRIVFNMNEKLSNEREWIKKNIKALQEGKTIIVQNENKVQDFSFNLIRYIAYSISVKDFNISFNLTRKTIHGQINEFIPEGPITNYVDGYSTKNLLVLWKLRPSEKWSFESPDGALDLEINNLGIEQVVVNSSMIEMRNLNFNNNRGLGMGQTLNQDINCFNYDEDDYDYGPNS